MQQEIEYPLQILTYQFKITTSSQEAQLWFDRGLLQCYNFNHEECINCCDNAIQKDSNCAMAFYLKSFAQGINYNNAGSLQTDQSLNQFTNWKKADELKNTHKNLQPIEIALIDALKFRVGDGKQLDHLQMDEEFSAAMQKLYEQFQENQFIIALYAESLMNLRPWNLWVQNTTGNQKYGEPYPNTLLIKQILEKGLQLYPDHPHIRHLWIHLMELSPNPELASDSCFQDPLYKITQNSPHLTHMPSHIDLICGNYKNAIDLNLKAIENDKLYINYRKKMNYTQNQFYTLYICHNYHFAVYAAMFSGNYEIAINTSRELIQLCKNSDLLEDTNFFCPSAADWLEGFITVQLHVYIRFGKWKEIIEEPFLPIFKVESLFQKKNLYCSTIATLHYARGIAYSVLAGGVSNNGQEEINQLLKKADSEIQLFEESLTKIPSSRIIFNNKLTDILAIGRQMLNGEYQYRLKNYDFAFNYLRAAVKLDDSLPYDEPWSWMIPTRHALGALLLEQGIIQNKNEYLLEAEQVYKQDLGEGVVVKACGHPNNIWSLMGLHKVYSKLQKLEEAANIKLVIDLQLKFVDQDFKFGSSCLCSLSLISQ